MSYSAHALFMTMGDYYDEDDDNCVDHNGDADDVGDDKDDDFVHVKSVLTACDRPILLRATSYCDRSG